MSNEVLERLRPFYVFNILWYGSADRGETGLGGNFDRAAADSSARVSGRLSEIVGFFMKNK